MEKTKTSDHLDILDAFRAVAILGVFCYHYFGYSFGTNALEYRRLWLDPHSWTGSKWFWIWYPLAHWGWEGVALFFVLSGFVISLSAEKDAAKYGAFSARRFYWKRFKRIWPPYIGALLLFVLYDSVHLGKHLTAWDITSHVLLLQNYSDHTWNIINGTFWSIAVEFQLYLIYPLLRRMRDRWGMLHALYVVAGISLIARIFAAAFTDWNQPISHALWFSVPSLWFSWTLGAYLYERQKEPALKASFWTYAGLYALLYVCDAFKPLQTFGFDIGALGAFFAIDAAVRARKTPGKALPTLQWLGVISYSFYLLHSLVLDILISEAVWGGNGFHGIHLRRLGLPLLAIIGLALCIFLSWVYHIGVERRFMSQK